MEERNITHAAENKREHNTLGVLAGLTIFSGALALVMLGLWRLRAPVIVLVTIAMVSGILALVFYRKDDKKNRMTAKIGLACAILSVVGGVVFSTVLHDEFGSHRGFYGRSFKRGRHMNDDAWDQQSFQKTQWGKEDHSHDGKFCSAGIDGDKDR